VAGRGLHIYAALVKNLRGVIYSSLESGAFKEKLSWLRKRFRYRNLGLTPYMSERYAGEVRPYVGSLLVGLEAPLGGLEGLVKAYREITGLSLGALEAYCYASVFVSPILVLGHECARELGPLTVGKVLVSHELTDKDYKLHMRIADYTVLDFYSWATTSAQAALKALASGEDIRPLLEERRERVEKDKRRYWRVIADEGRELVLYLDLLPLLAEKASPRELRELLDAHGELMPATLAIITAVVV